MRCASWSKRSQIASAWLGVADDGVPVGHGQLTGNEHRGAFGAVLYDLVEVAPLGVAQRREHPVVDGEQVALGQAGEQPRVGAVPAADGQLVQQTRHADVTGGEAAATRPFDEGAGEKSLFPMPHGPVTIKLWRSAIQAQVPSVRTCWRLSRRGWV